ncbi:MAG: hypothetical protein QM764_01325 [Chitinophagaceae bacterium]
MKKIFTLAIGSLFALSVMAADHRPSVTVKNTSNYMLVIDGKNYKANDFIDLSNLFPGYHSIKVYQMNKRSFFGKKSKLVSSTTFTVKGKDVMINVDRFGKIDVNESNFGYDLDHGKGWDKNFGKNDSRDNHKGRF